MTSEDERCAAARKFQRIDEAFQKGDLEGLREAVADPAVVPNGVMPAAIESCLVYAIYHSPLHFIRTLLELGADPNAPVDDGFPPLIAAVSCGRSVPGSQPRTDVEEIIRLLLSFRADPNQRGINDYTPLHMAVAERNKLAVEILLDHGADPELRTRIDDLDTPLEMAQAAGLDDIAAVFARHGQHGPRRLRSGLTLLNETRGKGEPVRRGHRYRIRLRLWLKNGRAVRWQSAWGPVGAARLEENGETLITELQLNRRSLINGLFYGVDGMCVGGTRRLEISPHLAYREPGVPGVIPGNAVLIAEITILEAVVV
jgi:ankyrin repeat protein